MDSVRRSREILVDLDPDQRAAVTACKKTPLLVAAGPGAGKTRVLTHRIGWLVAHHEIPAGDVMALTFTNAAATEMGERLYHLIGAEAMRCRISTIHTLAARIVRAHAHLVGLTRDYTIFDQDAQKRLAARVLEDGKADVEPADLVRQVSLAKSQLRDPVQIRLEGRARLAQAYIAYDTALKKANALDFEGLVVEAIAVLGNEKVLAGWRKSIGALLVDEFQDVSEAQFELLRLLVGMAGNTLTVIGDEDQSLYSWRGASTALLIGFERYFPRCHVINLARNYRSHQGIVKPAARLINHNEGRRNKDLSAVRESTSTPRHVRYRSEESEALGIVQWAREHLREGAPASELAVLLRVRSLPLRNELERALAGASIAYQAVGSVTLWQRSEVRDVLALFHLLSNDRNLPAFAQVLEQTKGLGAKATAAVLEVAEIHDMPPVEVCGGGLIDLGPKRNEALAKFVERFDRVASLPVKQLGFGGWVGQVIADWGFSESWQAAGDGRNRRESVVQLYRAAEEFQSRSQMEETGIQLSEWLNELSLHAPQSGTEAERQGLALATIHVCKGLEFSHVWIGGFDEGVLPSKRSLEEGREDEERRLAYVAMTRARETLTVSSCELRRGQQSQVSRFVKEAGIE